MMCIAPSQAMAQSAPPSIRTMAQMPQGQRPLVGTQYGVIDLNRPALLDPQGFLETEKGITVTHPRMNQGAWTNIPSIWNGQHFQGDDRDLEDWAVENALREGRDWPTYPDERTAVDASKARSKLIGALRGM